MKQKEQKFMKTRERLRKDIGKVIVRYLSFIDLTEYDRWEDLSEDIWYELFDEPLAEICKAVMETGHENR